MSRLEAPMSGLRERMRRIGTSLLTLVRCRAELLAIELQEEKLRLLSLLVWFGIALALGIGGFLIGIGTLALWLWSAAGYLGLIGLMLMALVGAGITIRSIRRKIRRGPAPFADTIAEFRKDFGCLHGDD